MRAVWPNIAVTDDSLVQCITEIRKALEDDGHTIIKTMPKRGYVLEPGVPGLARPKVRTAWLAAGAAMTVALAAVLWLALRMPGR